MRSRCPTRGRPYCHPVTTARTAIVSAAIFIAALLMGVALPAIGVPEWANSGVAVLIVVAAGMPIGWLVLQHMDSLHGRR